MRVVEVGAAGSADTLVPGRPSGSGPRSRGGAWCGSRPPGSTAPTSCSRQGHYPPPPGASDVLGLEVSGTVAAVGRRSDWLVGGGPGLWAGDRGWVCGVLPRSDGAVPVPIPRGIDVVDAAALPEACLTVWTNVFERGRLASGERLLVHGGSSGIRDHRHPAGASRGGPPSTPRRAARRSVRRARTWGRKRAINYRDDGLRGRSSRSSPAERVST